MHLNTDWRERFQKWVVAKQGDTSDNIWGEWKELEKRYHVVTGEIHKQRKEGVTISDTSAELKQFAESLVALICDWIEFNASQISQGKLKKQVYLFDVSQGSTLWGIFYGAASSCGVLYFFVYYLHYE